MNPSSSDGSGVQLLQGVYRGLAKLHGGNGSDGGNARQIRTLPK
jgi:hypothetical protein